MAATISRFRASDMKMSAPREAAVSGA